MAANESSRSFCGFSSQRSPLAPSSHPVSSRVRLSKVIANVRQDFAKEAGSASAGTFGEASAELHLCRAYLFRKELAPFSDTCPQAAPSLLRPAKRAYWRWPRSTLAIVSVDFSLRSVPSCQMPASAWLPLSRMAQTTTVTAWPAPLMSSGVSCSRARGTKSSGRKSGFVSALIRIASPNGPAPSSGKSA